MGLSTKETTGVVQSGGGMSKTLSPGKQIIKINSLELKDTPWAGNALILILNVEGKEIEGFEGFAIDINDKDGAKYKGQVGKVKATPGSFGTHTKSGKELNQIGDVMNYLKSIAEATDFK